MRTFTRVILTIGSSVALLAATALSVSADDEAFIKYRQSAMKAMGGHMGGAVAIVKGEVPYESDLVAHATGLDETAQVVPNAFKQETSGGETRAKPAIWKDSDEFMQKIKDLQSATAAFLAAAKSGGKSAAGEKLGAVGDACKGCHETFREKKS